MEYKSMGMESMCVEDCKFIKNGKIDSYEGVNNKATNEEFPNKELPKCVLTLNT